MLATFSETKIPHLSYLAAIQQLLDILEREGDFITWGVPIFFYFIQNGANFAQPLLWVPRAPP
jgi:hypothetical protein